MVTRPLVLSPVFIAGVKTVEAVYFILIILWHYHPDRGAELFITPESRHKERGHNNGQNKQTILHGLSLIKHNSQDHQQRGLERDIKNGCSPKERVVYKPNETQLLRFSWNTRVSVIHWNLCCNIVWHEMVSVWCGTNCEHCAPHEAPGPCHTPSVPVNTSVNRLASHTAHRQLWPYIDTFRKKVVTRRRIN